jgi:hypothetical protein
MESDRLIRQDHRGDLLSLDVNSSEIPCDRIHLDGASCGQTDADENVAILVSPIDAP